MQLQVIKRSLILNVLDGDKEKSITINNVNPNLEIDDVLEVGKEIAKVLSVNVQNFYLSEKSKVVEA